MSSGVLRSLPYAQMVVAFSFGWCHGFWLASNHCCQQSWASLDSICGFAHGKHLRSVAFQTKVGILQVFGVDIGDTEAKVHMVNMSNSITSVPMQPPAMPKPTSLKLPSSQVSLSAPIRITQSSYFYQLCEHTQRRRYPSPPYPRRRYQSRRRRSFPVAARPTGCVDLPAAWDDKIGRSCQVYAEEELCTASGGKGPKWNKDHCTAGEFINWVPIGQSAANVACCVCGGGVVRIEGELVMQVEPLTFLVYPGISHKIRSALASVAHVNASSIAGAFYVANASPPVLFRFNVTLSPSSGSGSFQSMERSTTDDIQLAIQQHLQTTQPLEVTNKTCLLARDPSNVLRLAGGRLRGRLELYHESQWGSICAANLSSAAAELACNQLGYTLESVLGSAAQAGEATMPLWLFSSSCGDVRDFPEGCGVVDTHENVCSADDIAAVGCKYRSDCTDVPEWIDSWGLTCSVYESLHLCTSNGNYGENWRPNEMGSFGDHAASGYTPATACCACGGGVRNLCTDSSATWKDNDGKSCAYYERWRYCTDTGDLGPGWGLPMWWGTFAERGPEGVGAEGACCACGGGRCVPGAFTSTGFGRDCRRCPLGRFSSEGGLVCDPCASGSFQATLGATACEPCSLGKYSESPGLSECRLCDGGKFGSQTGQSQCAGICAVGTFSYAGGSFCDDCSGGTYSKRGEASCTLCKKGYVQPNASSGLCKPCNSGTFADREGQTQCKECNLSATTSIWGATQLADCLCPETFRFSSSLGCVRCPSIGIKCPGGHSIVNDSIDESPRLQQGFMSLIRSPLDVYTCVDKEKRCPGERSAYSYQGMCATAFDPSLPQCAGCKEGHHLSNGACAPCHQGDTDTVFTIGKVLVIMLLEVGLMLYMYLRWNRPSPSGLITFGLAVAYVQVLHKILQLPLLWPLYLQTAIVHLESISVVGFLHLFEVRLECFAGSSYVIPFLRDLVAPLQPCAIFIALAGIGKLTGRHLKLDHVLNTLGVIFRSVYITVAGLVLRIFITKRMPSGKLMVSSIPQLEFGSSSWLELCPLALAGFFLYCISFLTVVLRAVWIAPHRAATWPRFTIRYRFAFGALRPDTWWWAAPNLVYSLTLVVIQAAAHDIYIRLYLSTVALVIMLVLQFYVWPFKFQINNHIDIAMKSNLLILLIVSTTFVDHAVMSPADLAATRAALQVVIITVMVVPLMHAFLSLMMWVLCKPKKTLLAQARQLHTALDFRNVAMQLCLLSNEEFFSCVSRLGDIDVQRIESTTRSLIATFLGMQPSQRPWMQRIIPNVAFEVWSNSESMLRSIEAVADGRIQAAVIRDARCHLALMKLATELRTLHNNLTNRGSDDQAQPQVSVVSHSPSLASLHTASSGMGLAESIADGSILHKPMSLEVFNEILLAHSAMPESDIKLVYEYITCTHSAVPTLLNIMETLASEAPMLNDDQEARLRAIAIESMSLRPSHANEGPEQVEEESVSSEMLSEQISRV